MNEFKNYSERQIDGIIKSMYQHVDNCSKAKAELLQWADDLGYQVELGKSQIELWESLRSSAVPQSVTTSGVIVSQEMLNTSDKILVSVENSPIADLISIANTSCASVASTAISGATLSYQQNAYPPSYYQVTKIIEQRNDNGAISSRLRIIDDSLADEYENSWEAFHTASSDETRSPMFLMREVVNRIFHLFAPDDEVRRHFSLNIKEKITRCQRLRFMASRIDPLRKNAFLKEEKALNDIYKDLSYAHKPGKLDPEKSRGFLYQANELIKLLLDSFPKYSE